MTPSSVGEGAPSVMLEGKRPPTELKKGVLLKYKSESVAYLSLRSSDPKTLERYFKSNWSESKVSLFSNATIIACSGKKCRETVIPMAKQTTLIIFGKQLKDVPKKPDLPSGHMMEQLLAIGLMHTSSAATRRNPTREKIAIVFHWFLPATIHELIEWIVAISSSIPSSKQILTDDELTLSLVMTEAAHYNHAMMLQASNPSLDTSGTLS